MNEQERNKSLIIKFNIKNIEIKTKNKWQRDANVVK